MTAAAHSHVSRLRVGCVTRSEDGAVASVGGAYGNHSRWRLDEAHAIAGIEAGRWSLYVEPVFGEQVNVIVACADDGAKWLAAPTREQGGNALLLLPPCP